MRMCLVRMRMSILEISRRAIGSRLNFGAVVDEAAEEEPAEEEVGGLDHDGLDCVASGIWAWTGRFTSFAVGRKWET